MCGRFRTYLCFFLKCNDIDLKALVMLFASITSVECVSGVVYVVMTLMTVGGLSILCGK